MSNVLKGFFVAVDEDSRVVETSEILSKRIQEEEERRRRLAYIGYDDEVNGEEDGDGFTAGIMAENIDALLDENAGDGIIKASEPVAVDTSELDALNEQIDIAKSELDRLQQEASYILDDANETAERLKEQAYENGSKEGYQDGYARGMAEAEEIKQQAMDYCKQLEEDYQAKMEEIEPQMMDLVTDIYERIFKVELDSYSGIIFNILTNTINDSGAAKNIVIHISKECYPDIVSRKEALLAETGLLEDNVDFIQDATLAPSGCMIETENGVFDCSLETELKELKKKLMLLAYRKV
ncbi:MAG: hypothetical protein MJ133_07080 [Lachnospiraceae bacterium]|nr:hypothetical protein [Lachnospiraceae bacterium]